MSTATAKTITTNGASGGLLYSFSDTVSTVPISGITTPVIIDNSYTIPANTFQVGDVIKMSIQSRMIVNNSNYGLLKINLGGTNLYKLEFNGGASNPDYSEPIILTGYVTATNIIWSVLNNSGIVFPVTNLTNGLSIFTFNPTISNQVELTVQNTSGNGGVSGWFYLVSIEKA